MSTSVWSKTLPLAVKSGQGASSRRPRTCRAFSQTVERPSSSSSSSSSSPSPPQPSPAASAPPRPPRSCGHPASSSTSSITNGAESHRQASPHRHSASSNHPDSRSRASSTLPSKDNGKSNASSRPSFPPLVVSLHLDDTLQRHVDDLRSRFFPPHRNQLQGHVTLFHALPSEELDGIIALLDRTASSQSVFNVFLKQVVLRGGGRTSAKNNNSNKAVFAPLASAENQLHRLHSALLQALQAYLSSSSSGSRLTDQDKNPKFWAHATVVNKVGPEEAQAVFDHLQRTKEAEKVDGGQALGLDLWYYRGGPWEHIRRFDFRPRV